MATIYYTILAEQSNIQPQIRIADPGRDDPDLILKKNESHSKKKPEAKSKPLKNLDPG